MKPILIVANFKSNYTKAEAKKWLDEISAVKNKDLPGKKIVVCPSFTLLDCFKSYIDENKLPIELGSQDISKFTQGAYTGEVNGSQIAEFAKYVIVGHSERRTIGEDESIVEEKVKMAIDCNLTPILCVQNENQGIPAEVSIVAYEPIFAIGTGNPDTPENAEEVAKKIKEKTKVDILYGGSVTPKNISNFSAKNNINGVLVGGASLDAAEFLEIINNA